MSESSFKIECIKDYTYPEGGKHKISRIYGIDNV
jgi:hypothetical protein